MYNFFYQFHFSKVNEKKFISVSLKYGDDNKLVYIHEYDIINTIFNQVSDYFNLNHIKMTKNTFDTFYNTFNTLRLSLPKPLTLTIDDDDYEIDINELTPTEILFLGYIEGKGVETKRAKYWVDEYHLDINYTINRLITLNYLSTTDYLYNLHKATKRELAQFLEDNQASFDGNKLDIVNYILENFNETIISTHFSNLYYSLTELGKEIVADNQALTEFHKSYYRYAHKLSINEFYLLMKSNKNQGAKDVLKTMVEAKKSVIETDFDWNRLFTTDELENESVQELAVIINKVPTIELKQSELNVSDTDFFNIINKKRSQEVVNKENINPTDNEFFEIINKDRSINYEISNEIKPLKVEVNNLNIEEEDLPKIIESGDLEPDDGDIEIEIEKKVRRLKELNDLTSYQPNFLIYFLVSSILCIFLIYMYFEFFLVRVVS